MVNVPLMVPGNGVMFTVCVAGVPQPTLYVMVVDPPLTPVTTPDVASTVATPVLLLLHAPPDTLLVSVVVAAWQIVNVPPMVAATGLTVIACVATPVPHKPETE